MQSRRGYGLADARGGQHAPVAHQGDAPDEPRQGQFARAPGGAMQPPWQSQLPAQPQHGGHVPVGQGALHRDFGDRIRRTINEIGNSDRIGRA